MKFIFNKSHQLSSDFFRFFLKYVLIILFFLCIFIPFVEKFIYFVDIFSYFYKLRIVFFRYYFYKIEYIICFLLLIPGFLKIIFYNLEVIYHYFIRELHSFIHLERYVPHFFSFEFVHYMIFHLLIFGAIMVFFYEYFIDTDLGIDEPEEPLDLDDVPLVFNPAYQTLNPEPTEIERMSWIKSESENENTRDKVMETSLEDHLLFENEGPQYEIFDIPEFLTKSILLPFFRFFSFFVPELLKNFFKFIDSEKIFLDFFLKLFYWPCFIFIFFKYAFFFYLKKHF